MSATALRAAATGEKAPEQRTILQLLSDPRVGKGLAAVAGRYMTPDRTLRLCINAVKKTPLLGECDPQTVLGAFMTSVALGLEPNTVQQQALLLPYKRNVNKGTRANPRWVEVYDCQFQIGARGYVTLAYRSPYIASLDYAAIHDGDHFKHMRGSNTFLEYATELRTRGPLIGAFSHVKLKDNAGESAIVLPLDEILKIRGRSETFKSLTLRLANADGEKTRQKEQRKLEETPWVMWEDDMAAKSAVKKHAKILPLAANDQFAVAAGLDEQGENGALDLAAMVDPERARAAMDDVDDVPVLENQPSEELEISGEAFGATARQAQPVQQQADQEPAAVKAAASPKPATKRAPTADLPKTTTAAGVKAWIDDIAAAKTRDTAIEALDLARSELNEADLALVSKAFHERWGD